MADLEHCGSWEQKRASLRKAHLADGRRMSFKNLNDKHRQFVLCQFLEAANHIPGIIISFAIEKKIKSLFSRPREEKLDMTSDIYDPYRDWSPQTFERLLRAVHFISIFLSGLSRENQNVLWFTDEDEIAPNTQRLTQLTELFANISSHYLSHDLNHVRCGTTKSDNGTRQLEDMVAIPDLVGGATAEVLTKMQDNGCLPRLGVLNFMPPISEKSAHIYGWLNETDLPLKRIITLIAEGDKKGSLVTSFIDFSLCVSTPGLSLPFSPYNGPPIII
jgi:hypothetical protein